MSHAASSRADASRKCTPSGRSTMPERWPRNPRRVRGHIHLKTSAITARGSDAATRRKIAFWQSLCWNHASVLNGSPVYAVVVTITRAPFDASMRICSCSSRSSTSSYAGSHGAVQLPVDLVLGVGGLGDEHHDDVGAEDRHRERPVVATQLRLTRRRCRRSGYRVRVSSGRRRQPTEPRLRTSSGGVVCSRLKPSSPRVQRDRVADDEHPRTRAAPPDLVRAARLVRIGAAASGSADGSDRRRRPAAPARSRSRP